MGRGSRGSRGLMVESRTCNWKVASLSLSPAGIVGGGSECTALSPPSIPRRGALGQGNEPPTAPRAPQHKRLPTATGVCSLLCVYFGCVFTAVCVLRVCVFTAVCILRVCVHCCVCTSGVCVHCCVCTSGVCSLLCVCTLDGLIAEHKFRVCVTVLGCISLSHC